MVPKIIQYFNQCKDILKGLVVLVTSNYIYFWKSKGLSDKNITAPTTTDYSLNPQLSYLGINTRLEFRRSCLKQHKITYSHGKIVNIYIVYELDKIYTKISPTLVNCLFGAVSLTKNIDKYKCSRQGIGFDRRNVYSFGNGFGRNVIIFGADISVSVDVDNQRKDIFIPGDGPTQGLGEHSLTTEKMYPVNFTKLKKNIV